MCRWRSAAVGPRVRACIFYASTALLRSALTEMGNEELISMVSLDLSSAVEA